MYSPSANLGVKLYFWPQNYWVLECHNDLSLETEGITVAMYSPSANLGVKLYFWPQNYWVVECYNNLSLETEGITVAMYSPSANLGVKLYFWPQNYWVLECYNDLSLETEGITVAMYSPSANLGVKLYFWPHICPQYLALPFLFWKYTLWIWWCLCVCRHHYRLYQLTGRKESEYKHHVTRGHLYLYTF
jgi:hypothetical protein